VTVACPGLVRVSVATDFIQRNPREALSLGPVAVAPCRHGSVPIRPPHPGVWVPAFGVRGHASARSSTMSTPATHAANPRR